MGSAIAFLKKKGPGGIPMGVLAAGAAVILFFGWKHFHKSSSSSSSSTDTTATDTTGAVGGGGGAQPSGIDQTLPTETTTPGQTDTGTTGSTGSGDTSTTDPETGKKKKHKEKIKHVTPVDKKQGHSHTTHRRLPVRKSRNHHAPKTEKRPHSKEKAKVTSGVRNPRSPVAESRHGQSPSPPALEKKSAVKHPPTPPHYEEPHKTTKQKRNRG
jgi:hypothetical protein